MFHTQLAGFLIRLLLRGHIGRLTGSNVTTTPWRRSEGLEKKAPRIRNALQTEENNGSDLNPLNAELNPIRHLLALVGARHIVHVSRIRVNPRGNTPRLNPRAPPGRTPAINTVQRQWRSSPSSLIFSVMITVTYPILIALNTCARNNSKIAHDMILYLGSAISDSTLEKRSSRSPTSKQVTNCFLPYSTCIIIPG